MNKTEHTTKSGPGRRHVEGTNRGGKHRLFRYRLGVEPCVPGAKLARKVAAKTLTKRG